MARSFLQALVFTCLITFGMLFIVSCISNSIETSKEQQAIVKSQEGISIFIMSTPVSEYEFLGTVKKTGLVWSGKPDEMFNGILKKCKKEFPLANGIIFSDISLERADCIKLK